MTRARVYSILKGILLIIFAVLLAGHIIQPSDSNKTLPEITAETLKDIDMLSMVEKTPNDVKLFLQLNPGDYKEIVYYKSDDVMQPSEILIVHFNSQDQYDAFESAVNAHVNSQANIFEGYAQEQYELTQSAVIQRYGNYGIFVIHPDAMVIYSQFRKAL